MNDYFTDDNEYENLPAVESFINFCDEYAIVQESDSDVAYNIYKSEIKPIIKNVNRAHLKMALKSKRAECKTIFTNSLKELQRIKEKIHQIKEDKGSFLNRTKNAIKSSTITTSVSTGYREETRYSDEYTDNARNTTFQSIYYCINAYMTICKNDMKFIETHK